MKISEITLRLFWIAILMVLSCKQNTAIEGDQNRDNTVVIGEGNTINVKKDKEANEKTISIAMQANNDNTDYYDQLGTNPAEHRAIKYGVKIIDNVTRVTPILPYKELFDAGGPIQPMETIGMSDVFFAGQLPNLDFKIANNSDEIVFLNKLILNVKSSRLDLGPLIVLSGWYEINLANEGWSRFSEFIMEYDVFSEWEDIKYDKSLYSRNIDWGYEKDMPMRYNFVSVSYYDHIAAAIEAKGLDYYFKNKTNEEDQLSVIRESKRRFLLGLDSKSRTTNNLSDIYIAEIQSQTTEDINWEIIKKYADLNFTIAGRMKFSYPTGNGVVSRSVKFKFEENFFRNGLGGGVEPSFQYNAIMLKNEGQNYTIEYDISQSVKPKDVDRFLIRVGSSKSSIHDLDINFIYNGGELYKIPNVQLKVLYPRSTAAALKSEKYLYSMHDNLRIRREPNLESIAIDKLSKGEQVWYLNKKSDNGFRVDLNGESTWGHFLKVRTNKGVVGWVHEEALQE